MNIKITYDGTYPNLCAGSLRVTIGARTWVFPAYCLSSGGSVSFDKDWQETVTRGPWTINAWPERFPKKYKQAVEDAVNDQIIHGCCGGCV